MTTKLKKSIYENDVIEAPCRRCGVESNHMILTDVELQIREESAEDSSGSDLDYQIIQCKGCDTISFRMAYFNSSAVFHIEGESECYKEEYLVSEDYFPSPFKERECIDNSGWLPDKLQNIYKETLQALNNDQRVLAGIGIRVIIETVCKDKNATGDNLFKKIDSLVKKKVLSQENSEVLHRIRNLGNNAAHDVFIHEHDQLSVAFDVVEHLIEGTYILPRLAKAVMN
jgi:hypothetical protein